MSNADQYRDVALVFNLAALFIILFTVPLYVLEAYPLAILYTIILSFFLISAQVIVWEEKEDG